MLRTTLRNLITPKHRNYTFIRRGDNKGRLSVEAVAAEIKRPVEYTRALLMPFPVSIAGKPGSDFLYPAMAGRSSRPGGDVSGFVKAFPLFKKRPAFTAGGKLNYNRITTR